MSYPQPGATYRHEPKWLDEVRRAEGGDVGGSDDALKPMQQTVRGDLGDTLGDYNNPLDHYRSVDDIVNEGSNPSSNARFTSSSGRNPDKGD